MAHTLAKLTARHKEIARRYAAGVPVAQIAQGLGIDEKHTYRLTQDPLLQQEIERLQDKVDEKLTDKIEAMAGQAIDKLLDLMLTDPDTKNQRQCAEAILDRGGYGRMEKKAQAGDPAEKIIEELNKRYGFSDKTSREHDAVARESLEHGGGQSGVDAGRGGQGSTNKTDAKPPIPKDYH